MTVGACVVSLLSPDPDLVRYDCGYNFTVRSVPAKLVFAHHSNTHLVPGLVLADRHAYGQRDGLHLTKGMPIWEDAATPALFHGHVDAAAGRGEKENVLNSLEKQRKPQ